MKQARSVLLLILLTAVVVKVVWWVLEPMLLYVLIGLGLIWIFGVIRYRLRRW